MSMKKGEATRARILDAATDQASVRGLAAVSLNDVADAVGLSKSGVFKHFEAKEALHQALLEQLMAHFIAAVWEPARPLPRGRARLEAIFDGWLGWIGGQYYTGGCPIQAAAIELDDQPGPLRDFLRERLGQWKTTVRREFQALRDPPISDEDAEQAEFELKGLVLGFNEARRLFDDDTARRRADTAFQALLVRLERRDSLRGDSKP